MTLMLPPCAVITIATVTEGCLLRATRTGCLGMASQGHPCGIQVLSSQEPEPPAGPSALLCCTAVFCVHGLGSLSLCLFLPRLHCTGLSTLPLPLFYTLSFARPFPSPVNVYIVFLPLCVQVPPPRRACSHQASWRAPHEDQALLPLPSLSHANAVTLYRTFHCGLKLRGLGPTWSLI